MSKSLIKINGKIDRILKVEENGSATILFQNEENSNLDLKSSIIMVQVPKMLWKTVKDDSDLLEADFTCSGKFELRKKQDRTYIYVRCVSFNRLTPKQQKKKLQDLNKIDKNYKIQSEYEIREAEKLRQKEENIKRKEDKYWFKKIDESEFKEIDISKVKLVESTHLNSILPKFNIRHMNKRENLNPIAVRENDNGEYELITGLRSFIVGKLLSIDVKAYITDLDRETFKEKYSLDI